MSFMEWSVNIVGKLEAVEWCNNNNVFNFAMVSDKLEIIIVSVDDQIWPDQEPLYGEKPKILNQLELKDAFNDLLNTLSIAFYIDAVG